MIYTQDYDETSNPMRFAGAGSPAFFWNVDLQPYLKNVAVQSCPSARDKGANYGYSFNAGISAGNLPGRSIADIKEPARFPIFGDVWGSRDTRQSHIILIPCGTGGPVTYCGRRLRDIPPTFGVTPHQDNQEGMVHAWRHNDTANYAFGDGHVKAYRYVQLTTNQVMGNCANPNQLNCQGPPKAGIDWNGNGTDRTDGLYD
jgi:prepilin-type processing-associated H-X9-DG protein